MLLSLDMTSISKIGSLWLQVTEETMQEKGTVGTLIILLMSTHDCTCSCWKYEKKAMQIIRGAYANSLLTEKKKPTQNQGQS